MYLAGGQLVLSPSDLVAFLACDHLTELSLLVARGRLPRPDGVDAEVEVVQRRGIEHERRYLAGLGARGLSVVEVPDAGVELGERAARTIAALEAGPDIVYQATFLHEVPGQPTWRGHADFLSRVATPSLVGDHAYEPEDTKLARHVRPSAVLQLCEYAEQLTRVQGLEPTHIHVVLGGDERVTLRLADFSAYFRRVKRQFIEAVAGVSGTYPDPNPHCAVCAWRERCDGRRQEDDHLTLVAGLSTEQAHRLRDSAGIATVRELAGTSPGSVAGIGRATFDRLRSQARLQVEAREVPGPPPYELLPDASPGIGLGALPPPDDGDLFFDIEGDPFVGGGGLEYLLGVAWRDGDGTPRYHGFWARTADEERACFESFIDFVEARRVTHPQMHVFHYAPYERSALGRLMGRYATRESEVDSLFRGGVLVDLYRVVRQAVMVGTPSYSLKKLEALYRTARTEAITDAGSSIVEFERYLQTGDGSILGDLERYNEADCYSTEELRGWLESRREEYEARFSAPPSRPKVPEAAPNETIALEDASVAARRAALLDPTRVEEGERAYRTRALLADLLDWHRRENKPEYWAYYSRIFDSDEQSLFEDTEAISGLTYLGTGETVKRSVVHRYGFDPAQEHRFDVGDQTEDPYVRRETLHGGPAVARPGRVHSIDVGQGVIGLIRATSSTAPHPRAIVPTGPIEAPAQKAAIARVADSVIAHGIDSPQSTYRAVRDLLLAGPPRLGSGPTTGPIARDGEVGSDAAVRVALGLVDGCLAIQGPPGSGKTTTAAAIAVALIGAGKRVGVTGHSHAVISNLLRAILVEAARTGVAVQASQKSDGDQQVTDVTVVQRDSNDAVCRDLEAGTNLVAGTAWMFSDASFEGKLDCLLIDEAGQLSLANTVAVGTSARSVVLVGDPRQLAQPSRGTHPGRSGASALDHLLEGEDTIAPDRGIFLDVSHRLHPAICSYISEVFYAGRLSTDADCALQAVDGSGSGLRWRAVDHAGNRVSSVEEASAVVSLVGGLIGREVTDRRGRRSTLGLDDILVVAPYNAEVAALRDVLPEGARIGTVDKFQGQEAPVVITSLATSDLAEIPRGMEFLYSRNRLNVAMSRAQALAVLVCSPGLLRVRCHTVDQLRLANGLCRLVELSTPV